MKIKKYIFILSAFVFLSCGDFLEPKSQHQYIPKDANALQEMLIGEAYPKQTNCTFMQFLDVFSDDIAQQVVQGYAFDPSYMSSVKEFTTIFSWQPDMFNKLREMGISYANVWENLYAHILGANAALDYIDDVSGSVEEKEFVKAQAHTLRAFYYYMLVNYYGMPYTFDKTSLGVPLKLDSKMREEGEILMKRNTVEEVYEQIVLDLSEAERLFENLPEIKKFNPNYLVNMPMVQLFKSRIALYMGNWEEAMLNADKVIKNWKFTLLDLNTIGLPDPGKLNTYTTFNTYDSPEVIWCYGSIPDLTALFDGSLFLSKQDEGVDGADTRKTFKAADDLILCFQKGDLRKDRYITRELNLNEFSPGESTFYDTYLPYGKYQTSGSTPVGGGANAFALSFRLAEAYLNFSEAAALNGAEGESKKVLKKLLESRYEGGRVPTDFEAMSGDALMNFIRNERRKELCFEGQRWFDLRRYGMPSIQHVWDGQKYILNENDPSYVLPIDRETLDRNHMLEQNPIGPQRIGVAIQKKNN